MNFKEKIKEKIIDEFIKRSESYKIGVMDSFALGLSEVDKEQKQWSALGLSELKTYDNHTQAIIQIFHSCKDYYEIKGKLRDITDPYLLGHIIDVLDEDEVYSLNSRCNLAKLILLKGEERIDHRLRMLIEMGLTVITLKKDSKMRIEEGFFNTYYYSHYDYVKLYNEISFQLSDFEQSYIRYVRSSWIEDILTPYNTVYYNEKEFKRREYVCTHTIFRKSILEYNILRFESILESSDLLEAVKESALNLYEFFEDTIREDCFEYDEDYVQEMIAYEYEQYGHPEDKRDDYEEGEYIRAISGKYID